MRKGYLGKVVALLFFLSLFYINGTNSVYAGNLTEKMNLGQASNSQNKSYVGGKYNIKDFYNKENVIDNEIIVKYKGNKSSNVFSYLFGSNNSGANIEKIKVANKAELEKRIGQLQEDPNVEYVQPNYKYTMLGFDQISHNNNVQAMNLTSGVDEKQWDLNNLDIPSAWTKSTGLGVKIAVIDTGIDTTHEDLKGKVIGGQDFTNSGSYTDNNGHGTFTAGIIAADRANGIGISGIAYDAKLLSVKVLDNNGEGDSATIANGIIWSADNGAKLLNLSLGTVSDDAVLKDAVDYAASKGCIVVAATGNYGINRLCYPAAYDNVIAVGSTNRSNQWSNFSNYGKEIDVVAPGAEIYSTVPGFVNVSKYEVASGTSASAAVFSGQVALILSKQPNLTENDILNKIKNCSFRLTKTYPDIFYGQGILDVNYAISGSHGQLTSTGVASVDDNTINSARSITGKTSFNDSLVTNDDANWYKVYVPTNTVVKLSFNNEQQSLGGRIFKNNLDTWENLILSFDQYSKETYITNYSAAGYYYVEVANVSGSTNSWTTDIQYLSINDPSLPKDESLKYNIDNPIQGAGITGDVLKISGWVLSDKFTTKIEARVDNQISELEGGQSRPDVFDVYPEYYDPQSGFSGKVDLSKLPYGNHTLNIIFTDMTGVVTISKTITFTIVDTLKYSVDTVKTGMDISSSSLSVGGWALSKAGITKVEAIVDNDSPIELKYGLTRVDVGIVYKEYDTITSGFSGSLDIRKYSYGAHNLRLKVTDRKGRTVLTSAIKFNISSTLKTSMDTIRLGDVVTGSSLNVGGWALSKLGITKVEAIIDDNTPVTVYYGVSRVDVYNVFKDYNNKNSGFNGKLDISKLSYGEHYLKLRITEAGVRVTTLSPVKFNVGSPVYCIDTPSNNKDISGNSLRISGWALSKAGIQKIEVLVDGTIYKQLQYGLSRPDVYNVFKEYNNQNSGFNGTIDTSKLSYGVHYIRIKITDKIGRVSNSNLLTVNIVENKIYAIDSPQNGKIVKGSTLDVWGWALSTTGIEKVETLIDGSAQNIQYGISRQDVYNAYKGFNNLNSGFGGKVDISKLSVGKHFFVIKFTDARGRVSLSEVRTFTIQK